VIGFYSLLFTHTEINPTAACRVIIASIDRPPPVWGGGTFFGSQTVDRLFHPSVQGPRQWDGPGFEFSSIHGKSNNDDDEMR
jgi:hypothetical protein